MYASKHARLGTVSPGTHLPVVPLAERSSPLQQAVSQLEAFRASLGDAAIDAAVTALRQHSPPTLEGAAAPQRLRQVSVLFADVADSTAMLSRVGADEAMDLLGAALQVFSDAVRQWGGDVLRFTGDGIKAAFGTRGIREDEAERAVRAGLQILEGSARHAERVQRELGVADFGVRVGIHTGPVLLGGGMEAERSAMGHAVHLAARMEQSAPRGRLRISEATWSLVRGLFIAEEQPSLVVKGHAQPLRTWLVSASAPSAEPAAQRGVDGADAPLVGRDDELAQLLALGDRTRAQRRSTVALVLGEAGVGKTRIRRELLRAIDSPERAPTVMQARAHPSSPLQPYGLLRQLLARHLDIPDDLPALGARERLASGLAPWLPDEAGAACIGHLIGLDFADHPAVRGLGPSSIRAQAFAALRQALHAIAGARPLLVVLDDLHWADEASLAFVQTLLAPAGVPMTVLLLARPTLAERGVALEVPSSPDGLRLQLEPLTTESGASLLDALLRPLADAPPSLKPMLLERAQGNPLFLEALVRMLIDDGVIDARERPWRLHAERLAALRVPPTLVGVLQARLDALPANELHVLQAASIIGPVFWSDALQALAAAAPSALAALQQRNLITPRATSAFAHTEELAFVHQLLHETTYGTVLKPQRREGHARIARWLAERVTDRAGEFLAITAEHYERAGDSANALEYWDRADGDASQRFANDAAVRFAERALAQPALDDPVWRGMLMSRRRTKLDFMGRPEAAAALEELAAYVEACDHAALRADLLAHRMLKADHEGEPDKARAFANQVLEQVRRAGDGGAPSGALAHGELAWLATQEHRYDEVAAQVAAGIVHARAAALLPSRHGGYGGYEQQLRVIAIESLLGQERHVEALDAVAQALAALGASPSLYDRFNLGYRQYKSLRQLGRLDEAETLASELRELAQRSGVARIKVPALLVSAEAARLQGRLDVAEQTLQQAEQAAAGTDRGFDLPRVREQAGHLARARGQLDAACAAWDDAIERLQQQSRQDLALMLRCERAALDLALGRRDAALTAVEAALAYAQREGRPERRALSPEALVAGAEVLQALGDARAPSLFEDLRIRLDEQLAAIDTPRNRQQLQERVPHWRHAARLLDAWARPGATPAE